jgi:hypothetical protein
MASTRVGHDDSPRSSPKLEPDPDGLDHAVRLVYRVCRLAGSTRLVTDCRADLKAQGILAAVAAHNTAALFDWLMDAVSYQGISDAVAAGYMARHGQATWPGIRRGLDAGPPCPKLATYWHYHGCRYDKTRQTCAEPTHMAQCPVPTHRLRNGRLNQTAYSLFLFIRDIAGGDLVAWIDRSLANADDRSAPDRSAQLREALLGPLRCVYGVSDKVLSMSLATLLLGAGQGRPGWVETGGSMIAVDTLVHNFLHRTGILHRLHGQHPYGPGCYRQGGCAEIIETIARQIDAREFNRRFPKTFPRFVQLAIWSYCAQSGLDVCNGNRIDDRQSCLNVYCQIVNICDRMTLRNSK